MMVEILDVKINLEKLEDSQVLEITPIQLSMPFKLGSVNCYLLNTDNGFFLIDTSSSNNRDELERVLQRAGCEPGQLKMIILTHGDFDHSGNAAYLRKKFDAKTAMHKDDLGMVMDGNMFSSRQKGNNIFTRKLVPLLIGFGESERFEPDIYLEDGDNLAQFGIKAKVLSIPGHSQGSIGILTTTGDLFCGDLFESTKEPGLNSLMDDPNAAGLSVQKIKSLDVGTVYPGHGTPFQMEKF